MLAQARNAIIIPPLTSFDGNVITPGTPFMARLAAQLRRWLEYKVASNPDWQGMQVDHPSPSHCVCASCNSMLGTTALTACANMQCHVLLC